MKSLLVKDSTDYFKKQVKNVFLYSTKVFVKGYVRQELIKAKATWVMYKGNLGSTKLFWLLFYKDTCKHQD